jgi:nucleoside 2-deoxyribosyltransferase
MVFYPNRDHVFEMMKEICTAEGALGVAPPDGQARLKGLEPGRPLYRGIVEVDFDLIDNCDGAVFCLNPYNGRVEMDTGTAVEIGYAFAKRKIMSGWSTEPLTVDERIRELSDGVTTQAAPATAGAQSGTERDRNGLLVHSGELCQHVMAQISIELMGGRIFVADHWKEAFQRAVANLVELHFSSKLAKTTRSL